MDELCVFILKYFTHSCKHMCIYMYIYKHVYTYNRCGNLHFVTTVAVTWHCGDLG